MARSQNFADGKITDRGASLYPPNRQPFAAFLSERLAQGDGRSTLVRLKDSFPATAERFERIRSRENGRKSRARSAAGQGEQFSGCATPIGVQHMKFAPARRRHSELFSWTRSASAQLADGARQLRAKVGAAHQGVQPRRRRSARSELHRRTGSFPYAVLLQPAPPQTELLSASCICLLGVPAQAKMST